MHIYDISRELLSAPVYPGDPSPGTEHILRLQMGDGSNLTSFSQCSHNGTHIDAPLHFFEDGESVNELALDPFVGECTVITVSEGILTGDDIDEIIKNSSKRILFKGSGKAFLSQSAAFVLASENVVLVGTDAQSIAYSGDETATHKELLGKNIPILEGLDLSEVPVDGNYFLIALPLKIEGLEAAPARAALVDGVVEL